MIDLNSALSIKNKMDVGMAFASANDLATALTLFQSVIDQDASHTDALYNCAVLFKTTGHIALARNMAERALAVNPQHAESIAAMAMIEQAEGAYGRAESLFLKSLGIKRDARTLTNLAYLYQLIGSLENSLKCYTDAVDMDRTKLDIRFQRSMAAMTLAKTQKDWDEALSEYELRTVLFGSVCPLPQNGKPLYTGLPMGASSSRALLVCAEQGIGDAVMMGRYARFLKERKKFGKVYFMVPQHWKGMMSRIGAIDGLFAPGEELPEYDMHVPAMSLMRCERFPESAIEFRPYMQWNVTSPSLPEDKFKIGLVWQGAKEHGNDAFRSICVDQFTRPLARCDAIDANVEFYSLQRPMESQWAPKWIKDLQIDTLDALADAIGSMDLVITVDSAPLHIAGAMGVDTLALIPRNPDFRWGADPRTLAPEHSSLYPSVRLFRASAPKDWDPVLARVSEMVINKVEAFRISQGY